MGGDRWNWSITPVRAYDEIPKWTIYKKIKKFLLRFRCLRQRHILII